LLSADSKWGKYPTDGYHIVRSEGEFRVQDSSPLRSL